MSANYANIKLKLNTTVTHVHNGIFLSVVIQFTLPANPSRREKTWKNISGPNGKMPSVMCNVSMREINNKKQIVPEYISTPCQKFPHAQQPFSTRAIAFLKELTWYESYTQYGVSEPQMKVPRNKRGILSAHSNWDYVTIN